RQLAGPGGDAAFAALRAARCHGHGAAAWLARLWRQGLHRASANGGAPGADREGTPRIAERQPDRDPARVDALRLPAAEAVSRWQRAHRGRARGARCTCKADGDGMKKIIPLVEHQHGRIGDARPQAGYKEAGSAASTPRELSIRVLRYNPQEPGSVPRMQTYRVQEAEGMTLFIALNEIREKQDPSLQFDFVCRAGICGSCAMV